MGRHGQMITGEEVFEPQEYRAVNHRVEIEMGSPEASRDVALRKQISAVPVVVMRKKEGHISGASVRPKGDIHS